MLKDQRDLLTAFNYHGVKYLVIGAHAVGVHAEPRDTKDLDVFIKADEEKTVRPCSPLSSNTERRSEK